MEPRYHDCSHFSPIRWHRDESLTAYRRGILSEANKRRRDGVLVSVWTLDGKIFAKASPDGSPIRIFSEEQLDNL